MPRLLDLFCGAGGCSVGYSRAGFDVVGVDIKPQKNYPFEFVQADALQYLADHGQEFDAIHASPPCQHYSAATRDVNRENHPDLVAECRELLERSGKPWVIENVMGAPLSGFSAVMCGSMFGMKVRRHRLFETSFLMLSPPCNHAAQPVVLSVTGTGYGGKHKGHNGTKPSGVVEAREVMGVDWPMTIAELSNAIPPAYTFFVGKQLMNVLGSGV
jgi:DNA (cytosine-5)-methyltransferase 1